MVPTVVIITFCDDLQLLYGTLLVFKTLRTGFPTARVVVIDNGSNPKAVPAIENAAIGAWCEFRPINRKHYTENLRWLLLEQDEFGPLVLLDTDIILWENVEHWNFDNYLMAGRLMPCWESGWQFIAPRLHPSFLWIPDPTSLRTAVAKEKFIGFGVPAIGYVSPGLEHQIWRSCKAVAK